MEYNFDDHKKGDTFNGAEFTITVNSTPYVITGATITMSLVKRYGITPTLTLTNAVSGGLTITDGANGVFKIDEQVIDIDAGKYFYDIEIITADDVVKTYIEGTWTIIQDISEGTTT